MTKREHCFWPIRNVEMWNHQNCFQFYHCGNRTSTKPSDYRVNNVIIHGRGEQRGTDRRKSYRIIGLPNHAKTVRFQW